MNDDYGHRWTDARIREMEGHIAGIYAEAAAQMRAEVSDYFAKFKVRDKQQKALLEAGEISKEEYEAWRLAQIGRGERLEAMADKLAQRYTEANEQAAAYINGEKPSVYALNRNYAAYEIETELGREIFGPEELRTSLGIDFTLWDENTVRRLLIERPDLMPHYPEDKAVDRGIDLAWGKKQITASITSSILQGKSLKKMADDLQERIKTMNRDSAIRTARTAMTAAQNAGRQDGYTQAAQMGIAVRKRWVATKDMRTRHDHGAADGQTVPYDEPFIVGGSRMMFPGDGSLGAPGRQLYNCRCRMRTVEKEGIEAELRMMRVRGPDGRNVVVNEMTYAEWKEWVKSRVG